MLSSGLFFGFAMTAVGGIGYFSTKYKKFSSVIGIAGLLIMLFSGIVIFLAVNSDM